MIINTALSASLAVAADKSVAQEGDDITFIPSQILPTEKLLSPHHILAGGLGRVGTTSFVTFFEKLRAASTGASADVIVTLTRGLWTVTWSLIAKFQLSTQAVTAPVTFLIAMENDTQNISALYSGTNFSFFNSGVQRFLLKENANLRLDIVATAAGDAIQAMVCLNCEKNI